VCWALWKEKLKQAAENFALYPNLPFIAIFIFSQYIAQIYPQVIIGKPRFPENNISSVLFVNNPVQGLVHG